MALYATLHARGLLSKEELLSYYQNGGSLPAHTDRQSNRYIEISAGSLGHGLPIAVGVAHALKLQKTGQRVFVLIGDGESQEGSVWEAAMLAPKLGLDNLTLIVDRNNLQGYGRADELLSYEPIDKKFESFNWEVYRTSGHNHKALKTLLLQPSAAPKAIIADTTKGKGVDFMEDALIWHYYIVTDEHKQRALGALDEK